MKKIMKVLGKVLGAIAVLCLCIITVLVVKVYNRESRVREYEGELYSSECRSISYSDGTYGIKNLRTGEITLKGNLDVCIGGLYGFAGHLFEKL